MSQHLQVLKIIRENPGTSMGKLSSMFGLSHYRLNRVLRKIKRDLPNEELIGNEKHGVWIVQWRPDKCRGMVWSGRKKGGYRQCSREPKCGQGSIHGLMPFVTSCGFVQPCARSRPRQLSCFGRRMRLRRTDYRSAIR